MERVMVKDENVDSFLLAKKFFYILLIIYTASMIIFSKPHNEIYTNLVLLVLIISFTIYQILYTSKMFFINNMLVVYFIFYIVTLLSLTWSIDVGYSSFNTLRMVLIFIVLLFLYNILKIFKIYEAMLIGFLIGTTYNGILGTELFLLSDPIYLKGRFIGTTVHPNVIGSFSIFSILASVLLLQNAKNKVWIIINLLNFVLTFYVITLTASRSALIFSVIILFSYLLQVFANKNTRIYVFIFIAALIAGLVYFVDLTFFYEKFEYMMERMSGIVGTLDGQHADGSTTERLLFLNIMLDVFKENPLLGTGINTSRVFLHGYYSHNNYLELLAGVGIIGFTVYYSSFVYLIWKVLLVRDFWARYYLIVFVFIILMFDFTIVSYYDRTTLLIILLLHYMAEENYQKA